MLNLKAIVNFMPITETVNELHRPCIIHVSVNHPQEVTIFFVIQSRIRVRE